MNNPQLENGYIKLASGSPENDLFAAMGRAGLSGAAYQTLFCILRYTYGYCEKEARIPMKKFIEFTGRSRSTILITIGELEKRKMIHVRREKQENHYSPNKIFSKWEVVQEKRPVSKSKLVEEPELVAETTPELVAEPAPPLVAEIVPVSIRKKVINKKESKDMRSQVVDDSENEFRNFLKLTSEIFGSAKVFSPAGLAKWRSRRKTYSELELTEAFINLQAESDHWKILNNGQRPISWWLRNDEYIVELQSCHLKRSMSRAAIIS